MILDPDNPIEGLMDSKKLSEKNNDFMIVFDSEREPNRSWELDMENFYDVQRVEFTFKPAADVKINVETATNRKDWIEVASGVFISGSVPTINFDVKDNTKVRFLKVTFSVEDTSVPFGIGEIEVFGSTN